MSSLSFQECVSDTDDHTCLEDYHECIEEYQECLEVMHICLDDSRNSFAATPCGSSENIKIEESSGVESSVKDSMPQTENNKNSDSVQKMTSLVNYIYDKQFNSFKSDSTDNRQLKVMDDSDREGYETCQEEVFSSDENSKSKLNYNNLSDEHNFSDNTIDSSVSEPCIRKKIFSKRNHVCLDTRTDYVDLKCYDDENNSFGADQFFLVDYIDDDVSEEIPTEVPDKWISEPNVTEERVISRRFRKFLREYYNDYADCLEEYRKYADINKSCDLSIDNKSSETLVEVDNKSDFECMTIDNVYLPTKSSSSPALVNLIEPQTTEWNNFSEKSRRKSAFIPGYGGERFVIFLHLFILYV